MTTMRRRTMTTTPKVATKMIAYYRVSTAKQGQSGLGLEAQEATVRDHAARAGGVVVESYTEVESGKRCDRPELVKALAHAKRIKGVLCVAKMDRLTRNTCFLLTLIESGVEVIFADYPNIPKGAAGKFFLTQLASVAEFEAGMASERTKAGLKAARARGVQLGKPENLSHDAQIKGAVKNRDQANRAYSLLVPAIRQWRSEGQSFGTISDRLNAGGHATRTGASWNPMQVKRVLDRVQNDSP
jgi:DNA invertase Pin-like site-specific DNA recombinase